MILVRIIITLCVMFTAASILGFTLAMFRSRGADATDEAGA